METQPIMMKTVRLECPIAGAFSLFTERISDWWPAERRHTGDPQSRITLSPSGRFFERDSAGNEVELGAVLTWDPPQRLILDFYPGTDAEHPTRVEVRFTADGGATEVMILHSATKASESLFHAQAPRYDASWNFVLAALRRAADPSTTRGE